MQNLSTEDRRLAAIKFCSTSSGRTDPFLDRITRLAARFFSCPIAVVSLVDRDWVSFASHHGTDCEGVRRAGWFCAKVIENCEELIEHGGSNTIFEGLPEIRFYAGAPLIVQGSCAVGTLAVIDTQPHAPLDQAGLEALRDFAVLVVSEFERRGAAAAGTRGSRVSGQPAMVWVTDTAGNCTLLNRFDGNGGENMAANGRNRGDVIYPGEIQRRQAGLNLECRIPGTNGEDRWILEQVSPRFHDDGSFAGYIGICLDITERKKTEEVLRETQEWLSLAQSAARIGLWDWDIVNDAVKCSDQQYRLYGREPGSLSFTYDDWAKMLHPDDRSEHVRIDARNLPAGDEYKREFRCVWPDGSVHWLYGRAKFYHNEDGRAVRALGANIDISGFKEAEQQRDRAEQELIASREQLRQLAAHLESAREEERIRIAREIHDELGQILTVLKMDLEAVEARYRTSVGRPLKDITRRVTSMLKNLDFMIGTVRRISSELRPGILDHLGIAAAIEWQLQEFENRTGIRCCIIGLPDQLPLDAKQSTAVFRICQEMLTNVARHSEATSIKVEVRMETAWMTLHITDNGRGFDPSRLSDLEALGLLGMRERALLLGGSVEIESQPGRGTTVTLRTPISTPDPESADVSV
jgi:signal transduction histidine kinase